MRPDSGSTLTVPGLRFPLRAQASAPVRFSFQASVLCSDLRSVFTFAAARFCFLNFVAAIDGLVLQSLPISDFAPVFVAASLHSCHWFPVSKACSFFSAACDWSSTRASPVFQLNIVLRQIPFLVLIYLWVWVPSPVKAATSQHGSSFILVVTLLVSCSSFPAPRFRLCRPVSFCFLLELAGFSSIDGACRRVDSGLMVELVLPSWWLLEACT
jgi:hypothetical protein